MRTHTITVDEKCRNMSTPSLNDGESHTVGQAEDWIDVVDEKAYGTWILPTIPRLCLF